MRLILTPHHLPSGRFVLRPTTPHGDPIEDVRSVKTYEEAGETIALIAVRIRGLPAESEMPQIVEVSDDNT